MIPTNNHQLYQPSRLLDLHAIHHAYQHFPCLSKIGTAILLACLTSSFYFMNDEVSWKVLVEGMMRHELKVGS